VSSSSSGGIWDANQCRLILWVWSKAHTSPFDTGPQTEKIWKKSRAGRAAGYCHWNSIERCRASSFAPNPVKECDTRLIIVCNTAMSENIWTTVKDGEKNVLKQKWLSHPLRKGDAGCGRLKPLYLNRCLISSCVWHCPGMPRPYILVIL